MQRSDPFSDPTLRQAIQREADRLEVDPALRGSVEALFSEAQPTPRSYPIYRNRLVLLAAAVVVAGLSIGFLMLRSPGHEEEYTIAEARLWTLMAGQYRTESFASTIPIPVVPEIGPALKSSRYQLVGVRAGKLDFVDCTVRDYRRDDGTTLSLITARASDLLREPEEEPGERYDETSGSFRIVGGIKGDYWICVAAPGNSPVDLFDDALSHVDSGK